MGEHDSSKPDEHIVDVDIVRIAAHPQFNKPFMSNDIAILLLENDVEFTGDGNSKIIAYKFSR